MSQKELYEWVVASLLAYTNAKYKDAVGERYRRFQLVNQKLLGPLLDVLAVNSACHPETAKERLTTERAHWEPCFPKNTIKAINNLLEISCQ